MSTHVLTLAQAANQARAVAASHHTCMAIHTDRDDFGNTGYGYCPLDAFLILHGPMARANLVQLVDLIGTRWANRSDPRAMMDRYGKLEEPEPELDHGQRMAMSELADLI